MKKMLVITLTLAIAGLVGRHVLRIQRSKAAFITCTNCGQSLPDVAVFCAHCGQNLKDGGYTDEL